MQSVTHSIVSKKCQNCKDEFMLDAEDFGFYEKIKVPPPTFCPECRRQRRNSWRNTFSWYSRKCDSCGKSVVSLYAQDSGITIYCNKCWWSDKWDAKNYATDYDFSKPFFAQYRELIDRVPHMSVINDNEIASVNCEYTHDWWFSKNCYMCFSGWYTENVLYSFFILAGKDMMDCLEIRSHNEWLYESRICAESYNLKYSQFSKLCLDSEFLFNCMNCSNCFMCVGLVGKKYHFRNKQYSKEEYEKILQSYRLDTWSGVEKAKKEYEDFVFKYPRRYAFSFYSRNCVGDVISHSKNLRDCFVAKESENCRHCDFISGDKECHDLVVSGELSESYEGVVVDHSQLNLFGLFSVKNQNVRYTQHCHNSKYLFGCVGLKNASYCIFNKQYTKEEYEKEVAKIMKQMNEIPYKDKAGNEYRYGEFFPAELSPFGYNETMAMEDFPLSKDEILEKGFFFRENIQKTTGHETLKLENLPDSIEEVTDSILNEVLSCMDCGRNYKIVSNELIFYKKMRIPVPRQCFYCRHGARIKKRNPFNLWHRQCMCGSTNPSVVSSGSNYSPQDGSTGPSAVSSGSNYSPQATSSHGHAGRCEEEFETSYSPDRPEIVYCEKCYQKEMY